ncbi:hypothetical protein M569_06761, partial [Genlisea aurea]
FNLSNTLNPSVLIIIIILAVIFFISGLLHLLIRILLRPSARDPDEEQDNVTALQGQLQQLFHLHDSGVDQSFIDALPVFNYKAIIGVKDPFDCAVCLCEFEGEDKLRLLPKCSHAFHIDCIDTWLLSHSTCPLCRANLLPEFPHSTRFSLSPVIFVLESRGESSRREIVSDREVRADSIARVSSHLGEVVSGEIPAKTEDGIGEKVVQVKLGKFKNVDGGGSSSSECDSARRCFSMGSFAYVMDDNTSLQVPIPTPAKRTPPIKKPSSLTLAHRHALSECGSDSGRGLFLDAAFSVSGQDKPSSNNPPKPKTAAAESSRRAVSFRIPGTAVGKKGLRTASDIQISRRWESEGSPENHNNNDNHQVAKQPSFARRTLLWFLGKPNSAVHSFSSNV